MVSRFSASFKDSKEGSTADAFTTSAFYSEQKRVAALLNNVIMNDELEDTMPVRQTSNPKAMRTAATEVIEECTPVHATFGARVNSETKTVPFDELPLLTI
jgi:hypothetical protein